MRKMMSKKTSKPEKETQEPIENLPAPEEAAETPPAAEAAAEAAPAEVDLKTQLDQAQERYLRARAEMDNYRKRVQREFGEIRNASKVMVVSDFLTVFDHFQMATEHAEKNGDFNTLKQGMDMILTEFRRAFESLGVEQVSAVGKEFDPTEHEAVAHEPSQEIPAGQVLQQWKCGYRMGERLIRPATVVVSSGPKQDAPAEAGQTEASDS